MPKTRWNSKDRVISAAAVTKSDTVLNEFDALFIGTGGDVSVKCRDDSVAVVFKNIGNGEFFPVSVRYVMSTNTGASDIVGLTLDK